jgi:hypothetical protein
MSIENQIITYLKSDQEASVNELMQHIPVSRQMLHRVLHKMIQDGYLEKIGRPPKVFYRLAANLVTAKKPALHLSDEELAFLDEYFLLITETGQRLQGIEAMAFWCNRQKLPLEKTVKEFITTRKKYLRYFSPNGFIDGMEKLKNTKGFSSIAIDEIYYLDFYAIERFGKTRLGVLLHFAKQGQNRMLMNEIIGIIKEKILAFIKVKKIDAVGYIPPTIKRQLQFMQVLQKGLNLPLPHIGLVKVSGIIPVPQKALSKIEERIANAWSSIVIRESRQFKNILLMDDAVGSGATMNETSAKLKAKGTTQKVTGIAITGSFKGFDVIQEV